MNKLEEIKNRAKELVELTNEYQDQLFEEAVVVGVRKVYERVCNAFVEEMKNHGDLEGKSIEDIPSAERLLNASSVISELFPEVHS